MTAIEFENISKQYRLGLVSTRTLSHDLNRWWQTAVLHREDPYLKIGETNDRATKGDSEYVWALRDINFKVEQGDVVGIIGKNGAGKSTLLTLLSRVTTPTTGVIRARGRIASLLEVGTGFHSELTGRENIYMNGTIMGMSKAEVTRKLDEIVDFSGCERYLDTPVKRYSSGMTVRLGFAVAAHLDPEILVVDEVLAVGDAEFQKKAIGKMQDVSRGEGRTVLFVSHNMASIRMLCKTGLLLEQGQVRMIGNTNDIVDAYLSEQLDAATVDRQGPGDVRFENYEIENDHVEMGDDLKVRLKLRANKKYLSELMVSLDFYDKMHNRCGHILNTDGQMHLNLEKGGETWVECTVKNINLAPGKYTIQLWVGTMQEMFESINDCMSFYVEQGNHFLLRETPYPANCSTAFISDWSIK